VTRIELRYDRLGSRLRWIGDLELRYEEGARGWLDNRPKYIVLPDEHSQLRGCADGRVGSVYITDPAEMRDVHDLSEPCVALGFMLKAFAAGPRRVGCSPMQRG
jgi:hypothetical protein